MEKFIKLEGLVAPLDRNWRSDARIMDLVNALGPRLFPGAYHALQPVRAAGLVASAKRITTKNGGMMCFLAIEDFTGQIEVVVFPRLFDKKSGLLLPDAALAVSGKLSVSEETAKIIADDINPLAAGPGKKASEIRLRLQAHQETTAVFEQLKEVFARYRGSAVVYLHFTATRRIVRTDRQYWLEPVPEAIRALEEILGADAVQVS